MFNSNISHYSISPLNIASLWCNFSPSNIFHLNVAILRHNVPPPGMSNSNISVLDIAILQCNFSHSNV